MQMQSERTDLGGAFDPHSFLATAGTGRTVSIYRPNKSVIAQGDPSDAVFYIQQGKVKLTFAADDGRGVVFAILGAGDFFGHNCVATSTPRKFAASTFTECVITRLEKAAAQRLLQQQPLFSKMFITYLLHRTRWMQEDIVNLLMNSSQKRLARVLLMLARDHENPVEAVIPHVSHEMLAEMVGTTRSRINNFMNEFRRLGFIDYKANGNLRIQSSLAQVLLRE